MRISKKILACVLAAIMAFAMMPFTAFAVDAGASDIQAALNAGGNITLTEDLSSNISVPSGVSVVLDLNNHTVSASITNNGTLTIKNGTVVKNGFYFPDMGYGTFAIMNNGVLTLENITCTGTVVNKSTVATPSMTINSGTYHGDFLAVASLSGSTTEINGGTFTGQGFVEAFSGSTIVFNDGYISSVLAYGNGGSLVVNGGYVNTIKAENDGDTPASVKVNGGSFNTTYYDSDVKKFVDSSLNAVDNGDGTYSVVPAVTYVAKVGSTYYETLEDAIAAAQEGETIKFISDIDMSESYGDEAQHRIDISGVTIDLDGYKLTTSSRWCILFEGTNGTIKNGTLEALNNSAQANYQYGVYVWGGDDANGNPDPAQKATITLDNLTVNYGIHLYNSDVTIKDCTVTGSAKYYAIWADCESTAIVESGNFSTTANHVIGAAKYYDLYRGHIRVNGGNFTAPSGKKAVVPTASGNTGGNADTVKFYGGTVKYANGSVCEVNALNLGVNCTQNMETGVVSQQEFNDGANITVAETISQNFYLDEDYYGEDAVVTFYYNHNSDASEEASFATDTQALSDLPALDNPESAYDGARMLQVIQAPAQSTEPIVINVYANADDAANHPENVIRTIEYSVYTYCSTIIESSSETKLVELAKSTLDYAAAAQNYFNYNTTDMATKDNGGYYGEVASVDFDGVAGITSRPTVISGVSVVVKSDLEINFQTKTPISVTGASIETTDGASRFGASVLEEMNGDYYVINVKGIEPANMDNTITVETSWGTLEFTANSIMKLMSKSKDDKMVTLAKAMYLYGQAANTYFES